MPFLLGQRFTSHFNLLFNICSGLLVGSVIDGFSWRSTSNSTEFLSLANQIICLQSHLFLVPRLRPLKETSAFGDENVQSFATMTLFCQNITLNAVCKSGWPSCLRRCVQVAVYSCRREFESHSWQRTCILSRDIIKTLSQTLLTQWFFPTFCSAFVLFEEMENIPYKYLRAYIR